VTPTDITAQQRKIISDSAERITQAGLEASNCRLLPPGAIVFTTRATIGSLAIAGAPLVSNQSCENLLPQAGVSSEFLYYLLTYLKPVFQRLGAGTTFMAITRDDLREVQCAIPDEPEQVAIAAVIDAVDALLEKLGDELTAAQRLKTALMQQLFTRGMPGRHTKFKQTDIGEIPGEWEVIRIQKALDGPPFNGVSPSSRDKPPGTPILNVTCIYDGKCDPAHVSYVDVDEPTFADCRARKGDFYVLRGNGNRDYVATGGLLSVEPDPPCIFSDKLIRLKFRSDMVAESFIPMMWQSSVFLRRLQSKAESGSGLWMMSKRDIRREHFARPKIDEQEEIVSLLKAADANISACECAMEATRKLKTSLLQNLLTGKVRVKMET